MDNPATHKAMMIYQSHTIWVTEIESNDPVDLRM